MKLRHICSVSGELFRVFNMTPPQQQLTTDSSAGLKVIQGSLVPVHVLLLLPLAAFDRALLYILVLLKLINLSCSPVCGRKPDLLGEM